ncbi:MAG: NADH-quinone oxidoreductase subunit D [Deltaproteobacteria bacterium]|nr:MAG: NADH-quinone oxidoreductase subunit D [Deltaproteobacteria bacterium]
MEIERLPESDELLINMGPQHPSTHGVLRILLRTDGELVTGAKPDIGYLHRSLEKIAERVTYAQFMPFTDRLDYLAAANCNCAYAWAVEKLAGIEVPERAEYIRVIVCELNRIASHLIAFGAFTADMGAFTPFLYGIRERERINDLFEMICGNRLTYNYARIGGVSHDLPDGFLDELKDFLDYFEPKIDEYNQLISYNKIFVHRLANVAVVSKEDAIAYGLVGPNLRGSGVKWDLRKDEPYSVYDRFEFDVPVGFGEKGTVGDAFDRYMVRIREMKESVKILRQAIEQIPDGPVMAKVPRVFKPGPGEVYFRAENPRGELGFYIVSKGGTSPYRLKIRTGSFTALTIFDKVARGHLIADIIALIGSFDIVLPEIDR